VATRPEMGREMDQWTAARRTHVVACAESALAWTSTAPLHSVKELEVPTHGPTLGLHGKLLRARCRKCGHMAGADKVGGCRSQCIDLHSAVAGVAGRGSCPALEGAGVVGLAARYAGHIQTAESDSLPLPVPHIALQSIQSYRQVFAARRGVTAQANILGSEAGLPQARDAHRKPLPPNPRELEMRGQSSGYRRTVGAAGGGQKPVPRLLANGRGWERRGSPASAPVRGPGPCARG
jgi:hypothetical protein